MAVVNCVNKIELIFRIYLRLWIAVVLQRFANYQIVDIFDFLRFFAWISVDSITAGDWWLFVFWTDSQRHLNGGLDRLKPAQMSQRNKNIRTIERQSIFFISGNINARPSADINQLPLFELTRNKNVSKELQLLCVQWPKFFSNLSLMENNICIRKISHVACRFCAASEMFPFDVRISRQAYNKKK